MFAELVHHKDVRKAKGLTTGDLMTRLPVTASPDDPVEQAARMMHLLRVKRLPVVNSGGQLVGIVSRADVLAVFDRTDEEIHTAIVDTMLPARVPHRPAPVQGGPSESGVVTWREPRRPPRSVTP